MGWKVAGGALGAGATEGVRGLTMHRKKNTRAQGRGMAGGSGVHVTDKIVDSQIGDVK